MSGRECAYVSPYGRIETGVAKKFELAATGIQISSRRNERFDEECNQTFRGRRRRVEVPGPKVRVFQNHPPTRRNEAQIAPELLGGSSQGADLEPTMHEIEGLRLELTVEQIILDQGDVPKGLSLDKRLSRSEKLRIDIGSRY